MLFRRVREKLDTRERAITENEIEQQILAQPKERWRQEQKIARAEVILDLQAAPTMCAHPELTLKDSHCPGSKFGRGRVAPEPTDELRQAVYEFLRERVPIGTRLQVLAPQYSAIQLGSYCSSRSAEPA